MRCITLPYQQDSSVLFEKLRHLPWAVFIDSCYPQQANGHYDIISADPYQTFCTFGETTTITQENTISHSDIDPFTLVKQALAKVTITNHEFPFCGGAIGYFAYDLARRIEKIPVHTQQDIHIPDMAIGIYDWAIVVDHQKQQTHLVHAEQHSNGEDDLEKIQTCLKSIEKNSVEPFQLLESFQVNMSKQYYEEAFQRIKKHISIGDCYQVNFSQRFHAPTIGDPWYHYRHLRNINPSPFSAYLKHPFATILSLSPERFLKVENNIVETKPIKGTRSRHADPIVDKQLAEDLLKSEKDRAENLMIVDLLRNDISKSCAYGSVKVPKLFSLESFPAVHHLVSTITGELSNDAHVLDLLKNCFPGGSVTGAPKIRAMEIIEKLEPHRRNLYCGSIAYISYDGKMDSNIAIRTLLHHENTLYCSAGGAIVADSQVELEYQETFDKVRIILEA